MGQSVALPDGFKVIHLPEQPTALPAGFRVISMPPASGQSPDSRTATEVMQDQAANVLKGIPQAITGIPGAVKNVAGIVYDQLTGNAQGAQKRVFDVVKGVAQPFTSSVRGAAALVAPEDVAAPTREEFEQAAQGAGAQLGSILLPEVAKPVLSPLKRAMAVQLERRAPGWYQSALKPSTVLSPEQVQSHIDTALKYQIPVTPDGLTRLGTLVENLNEKIAATIDDTKSISPNAVAKRVNQIVPKFKNQVNPVEDLRALGAAKKEFLQQNSTPVRAAVPETYTPNPSYPDAPGTWTSAQAGVPAREIPIPGTKAQAMKTGTYRQLNDRSYGELKSASIEAQKALARGLKEELVAAFPEIAQLNAAESKLLSLEPIVERAVNRIANKDQIGIGTPIAVGGAKAATGSSGAAAAAGIMKSILDSPAFKSRAALAFHSLAHRLKQPVLATRALTRLGIIATTHSSGSEGGGQ